MISTKHKYIIHIVTFLVALCVILFAYMNVPIKNNKVLFNRNCTANPKNCQVEDYLNAGKIVVFGSSEVASYHQNQKYAGMKFFARRNTPILFNGEAGFVSFGMLAQLVSYSNKNFYNNARIVFTLSPLNFYFHNTSQTKVQLVKYLKNYELKRLIFLNNNVTDKYYKKYVLNYMKEKYKIKVPFILSKFQGKDQGAIKQKYSYKFKKMSTNEYQRYYNDALNIETKLDSGNNIGMHNDYFKRDHKPPYPRSHIINNMKNYDIFQAQEYLDFLMLVKFCGHFKIKPLFIMQDENFYTEKGRDLLLPLFKKITRVLQDNGMGYLDLWTYKKSDLVLGKTFDRYHPANVSWVMIDKKINDYFSQKGN